MPQFSVHKNKNPKTRNTYPYLVDVQSDLLSDLGSRVVVPLIKRSGSTKKPIKNLMPVVRVEGQEFVMMVPLLAGIATRDLGAPVASVAQHRGEVVAALDFLILGI
ncbi:MAG TPA: CcdB family protein [Steroidobacteraceae bacterium]|nr:CcdB family protein [Steroidobacteraceae bacterium]